MDELQAIILAIIASTGFWGIIIWLLNRRSRMAETNKTTSESETNLLGAGSVAAKSIRDLMQLAVETNEGLNQVNLDRKQLKELLDREVEHSRQQDIILIRQTAQIKLQEQRLEEQDIKLKALYTYLENSIEEQKKVAELIIKTSSFNLNKQKEIKDKVEQIIIMLSPEEGLDKLSKLQLVKLTFKVSLLLKEVLAIQAIIVEQTAQNVIETSKIFGVKIEGTLNNFISEEATKEI